MDRRIKGSALEEEIERYFKANGYVTQRNVVLRGRSGAPHEIDVLAESDDGVTVTRVAVECKAWAAVIEKDVVMKLVWEANDLAITKMVVVALGGWASGAETVAAHSSVDLWGPEELQRRLGELQVSEL